MGSSDPESKSTSNSESFLRLDHLEKTYPNGTIALKGVSLKVPKGSFVAVIGLSGSGKSTLLRCINRLHEPTSGEVWFEGQALGKLKEDELRKVRRRIGMIFQQFNLVDRRSVLTNVLTGRLGSLQDKFFGGVFDSWNSEWVEDAYAALKLVGLESKARVRADGLSGGQQQRVAIARSLMQKPQLLLADEPVASLDPSTSHSVMEYLRVLNKDFGMTIVCNLHFLSLVREYATDVVALRGGEKVFEGKPADISKEWFRDIYGEAAREVEIH